MMCEICGTKMNEGYRFTDWHNDYNDDYGTLKHCKKGFDDAIKAFPTGRFSIYDVSSCPKCETTNDEGILFNNNCPEYS